MASWIDWGVVQGNEAILSGQVLDDDGNPQDLTGITLSLVIKASDSVADNTGTTYAPAVTNEKLGKWSLTIPGSGFTTPGTAWYRLDVVDGGSNHTTVNLGNVTTQAA